MCTLSHLAYLSQIHFAIIAGVTFCHVAARIRVSFASYCAASYEIRLERILVPSVPCISRETGRFTRVSVTFAEFGTLFGQLYRAETVDTVNGGKQFHEIPFRRDTSV